MTVQEHWRKKIMRYLHNCHFLSIWGKRQFRPAPLLAFIWRRVPYPCPIIVVMSPWDKESELILTKSTKISGVSSIYYNNKVLLHTGQEHLMLPSSWYPKWLQELAKAANGSWSRATWLKLQSSDLMPSHTSYLCSSNREPYGI